MVVPKLLVLQSKFNLQYLRYQIEKDVKVEGLLKFSGDDVASPFAKFKLERSKAGNGLVHIRSCYNNKYWVHSDDQKRDKFLITASALEPEEDLTNPKCTLFKAEEDGPGGGAPPLVIRLLHAKLGRHVCISKVSNPLKDAIHLGAEVIPNTDDYKLYLFTVFNLEALVVLPKHVTLRAYTGKYLSSYSRSFNSDELGGDTVSNEIIANPDGTIRIKAEKADMFWYCQGNYMKLKKDENTNMSLFWPVKVADNVIALRNIGTNNFCGRTLTDDGFYSYAKSMAKEVRLSIEEAAISRSIYNVNFRLDHNRIYNKRILTLATGEAINKTKEVDHVDLKLSYTSTTTSTWNASVSLKLGVKTEFEVGVPHVDDDKVEISAEFEGSYEWGETKKSENTVETTYKVSIPSMHGVKVSLLATEGTCDVPFSYDQRDLLTDGRRVTYHKDDGVYTGVNSYNFKYEAKSYAL